MQKDTKSIVSLLHGKQFYLKKITCVQLVWRSTCSLVYLRRRGDMYLSTYVLSYFFI